MFDKHYIGLDLTGFENNGQLSKISRITLLVDDENSITAGDDTGLELTANCPHATQSMANHLLDSLKGYQYKMFEADSANIDPAAELGDGATAGGLYSTISRIDDDGSGYIGVAAPGEAEDPDEFPGSGPMTKEFNRKLAGVRSSITKTAEQIRLEIKNEAEDLSASIDLELDRIDLEIIGVENAVSNLELGLDSITQRVQDAEGNIGQLELTATGLSGRISDAEGGIAALEVSLDGIALEFSKTYLTKTDAANTYRTEAQVKSAIEASEDGIALEFSKTYLTKTDAANTYRTEAQVKSAIEASEDGIALEFSKTYLTKTDAANTYRTEAQVKSAIELGIEGISLDVSNGETSSTIKLMVDGVAVSSKKIQFTGEVVFASDLADADSGTVIHGSLLKTGTVTASKIQGEKVYLRDNDGNLVSTFTLNAADSAEYKLDIEADALAIVTTEGTLYFSASGSAFMQIKPGRVEIGGGMLRPVEDNNLQIGNSSYRLEEIYCVNDVIQTSDKEKKKDIEYGLSQYDTFFDRLSACSYRMVDGHERKHWGFVAQDIEQLLNELGIDSMDIAAFIKSPREENENEFDYGLRYGEFIALIVEQIQKLKKRVQKLEEAA